MIVFIQQVDGHWLSSGCYAAWYGFSNRADDVTPFTIAELDSKTIPLTKETIVFGSVYAVREALRQIGVDAPPPVDLPESLTAHFGRAVWQKTMGDIRAMERFDPPIHVKPKDQQKLFTGRVMRRRDDLLAMVHVDNKVPVIVQEYVEFVSEHRVYVLQGRVLNVCYYTGNSLLFPDARAITQMVADFTDAPVAYGIDVGVTNDGKTLLVEVNDAFALGNYGLHSWDYAKMIEARWRQMVGSSD